MATVTQQVLTCDLCGNTSDVQTRTFGLDGTQYEIDLCADDSNGLSTVAESFVSNARKGAAGKGQRPNGRGRRSPRKPNSRGQRSTPNSRGQRYPEKPDSQAHRTPRKTAAKDESTTGRSQPRSARTGSKTAGKAGSAQQQEKGIYVYGILPADIEITGETPGVGERPGPLAVVRCDGLAALISEVHLPWHLGSPEDLSTYREILDLTAIEVPVLPLRFGTVLAGEEAVTDELLGPRHDEFAAALEKLEGRAEFVVKGRYVQETVLAEVLADNTRAAQLRDAIQGKDPGAARDERTELGQILNETITVKREQDAQALLKAMEKVSAATLARKPARGLDAFDVAFLVAVEEEGEVERIIEALAREWDGRIEVELLGPMAAYDFAPAPS